LWQKRLTEAKIWSADLVHLKGFGFLLCRSLSCYRLNRFDEHLAQQRVGDCQGPPHRPTIGFDLVYGFAGRLHVAPTNESGFTGWRRQ